MDEWEIEESGSNKKKKRSIVLNLAVKERKKDLWNTSIMTDDLPPTYSEACQTRVVIPSIPVVSTAGQHPPSTADNAAFEGDRPPSPSDVQVTFDYPTSTDADSTEEGDIRNELSDYQQESYVRRMLFLRAYINYLYANQQDPPNNRHLPAENRQRYEQVRHLWINH